MTGRSILQNLYYVQNYNKNINFESISKHTCIIYIKYILVHVKYITLQNGDQLAGALRHFLNRTGEYNLTIDQATVDRKTQYSMYLE